MKKMKPIIVHQETPHYMPNSQECNGLLWKAWGIQCSIFSSFAY